VDEAHKMISEEFGENWRNEYIVWDCSAGIGNLTRDYKFKELYLSTIRQSDVDLILGMGHNPGSTIFQYDFLNDSYEKLPEGLRRALEEKKPILFLNNPPYGTANGVLLGQESKTGIATDTVINKNMIASNMGNPSQQLYCQFFYRMAEFLKENNNPGAIATFSNSAFLQGSDFENLRTFMLSAVEYKKGFLFNAGHFGDVSAEWGVAFTLFSSTKEPKSSKEYSFAIKELDENYFPPTPKTVETKVLYNISEQDVPLSEWVREFIRQYRGMGEDAPQMSNAISVKEDGRGALVSNSLGYLTIVANNPYQNKVVYITSSCSSAAHGFSIMPEEQFKRTVSAFTARKLITTTWTNQKDEYLAPDTSHPDYEQWNNDAIVYSLFQSASQQSSLRQIDYKGKKWDIFNHFFFMSKDEMKTLADEAGWHEMYNDIVKHGDKERYVYEQLQTLTLSPDAQKVLDKARELVKLSFKARMMVADDKPEYHLSSWDAGFYQIKNGVLKEFFPEEYKEFVKLFHEFEDRMREGVYTFGFLRK